VQLILFAQLFLFVSSVLEGNSANTSIHVFFSFLLAPCTSSKQHYFKPSVAYTFTYFFVWLYHCIMDLWKPRQCFAPTHPYELWLHNFQRPLKITPSDEKYINEQKEKSKKRKMRMWRGKKAEETLEQGSISLTPFSYIQNYHNRFVCWFLDPPRFRSALTERTIRFCRRSFYCAHAFKFDGFSNLVPRVFAPFHQRSKNDSWNKTEHRK